MDQGQLLATLPAIECTSSNRTGSLDGRVRWYLYTHCSVGKMHYLLTVDGLNSAPPADKPAVTGAGCQPRVSLKPLQVDHRSALVLWKAGSTLSGCLRSEWLGVSPKGRGDLWISESLQWSRVCREKLGAGLIWCYFAWPEHFVSGL